MAWNKFYRGPQSIEYAYFVDRPTEWPGKVGMLVCCFFSRFLSLNSPRCGKENKAEYMPNTNGRWEGGRECVFILQLEHWAQSAKVFSRFYTLLSLITDSKLTFR